MARVCEVDGLCIAAVRLRRSERMSFAVDVLGWRHRAIAPLSLKLLALSSLHKKLPETYEKYAGYPNSRSRNLKNDEVETLKELGMLMKS